MAKERGESSTSQEYETAVMRRKRMISLLHGPLGDRSLRSSTHSRAEAPVPQGARQSSPTIKMSSQADAAAVNTASESNSQSGAQQTMVKDSEKGSAGDAGHQNAQGFGATGTRSQAGSSAGAEEQTAGPTYPSLPSAAPATPALNDQITQAVQFTNFQNYQGLETMISIPDSVMTKQSSGHASQDAETYMNGVMQISMAAQAIVAAKIAQDPALAATPALTELNEMVTNAIAAFQDVSG
ncbi:hypothetical protein PsAD2_00712 [Pseudovibrio axinellae]|uniref:Killing trait n=1 Tax=Pseudovibrio axinellae TaxID=989403 RepID=A0A166AQE0_9HYPH|nr:hypothetical protein [Pseudovibrio axinellae]KZL21420.1 hypothetical protein PsAD2_00712 [Pseudovibrio axinellae]SEQ99617.1 hypothetical protein SAMN05421798_105335 [Pseudovibrio axinellae]